ncbi:MAG: EamA family transporter [Candidatus Eisenbacteria bacterium]|uniref:EamA family transporter n=1 Tax=Eiseniibacteriota bacterium TaxID=2212470 RepID=A0A849SGJ8_UNCEI|nr:EamA family transporter [Candidatus Eisenbacteria bacterium]
MTSLTVALVLASALLHSIWNLWAKQIGPTHRSTTVMWALTVISAVLYAPAVWLIAARDGARVEPSVIPWILASGAIHVGYFILLLRGYAHADLSVVYPVARGVGPLLSAVGAVLLLHEPFGMALAIGGGLVALGIAILTLRPGLFVAASAAEPAVASTGASGPPARAAFSRTAIGVGYGLATGATIALYTLWDGASVQRLALSPLLYYWGGEVVRVVLLTPFALRDRAGVARLWREQRVRVVGIATLSPLAYILVLFAYRHGSISRIAPMREVSILFGAWLGALVLGERDRMRRVIAALAFATGVVLLARG